MFVQKKPNGQVVHFPPGATAASLEPYRFVSGLSIFECMKKHFKVCALNSLNTLAFPHFKRDT